MLSALRLRPPIADAGLAADMATDWLIDAGKQLDAAGQKQAPEVIAGFMVSSAIAYHADTISDAAATLARAILMASGLAAESDDE